MNKAAATIRSYTEAPRWFASAYLLPETDKTSRIDRDTGRRIDRYLRDRARHPRTYHSRLWLGGDRGPLTRDRIYQMIKRRPRGRLARHGDRMPRGLS